MKVASGSRAVVMEMVTIGVAVTVGDLSAMRTRLRIAAVQGSAIGQLARLNIRLGNTGQTFSRAAGTASCAAGGRQRTYSVRAGTILPGDSALITVNTPGLPLGATVPCVIHVGYGSGQAARWAGAVSVPGSLAVRYAHTGDGVYAQLPQSGIPVWGIALIGIGSALLAGVGVLLYRQRRLR
jgi:LPXTG-motif cell wall-anchored protein